MQILENFQNDNLRVLDRQTYFPDNFLFNLKEGLDFSYVSLMVQNDRPFFHFSYLVFFFAFSVCGKMKGTL